MKPALKYIFTVILILFLNSILSAQPADRNVNTIINPEILRQQTEKDEDQQTAQDKIVDPEEYIVGPGDELTIFLYGAYTREYKLKITPEGSVLIPEFGQVELGQVTLANAKDKISSALSKRYRNVTISITLSGLRKLKVSVDGEVALPGIYTVSSIDRVTSAITMAGGLLETASERNIRLNRNGEIINVDLLSFARGGLNSLNPYLIEGDKIFVPPAERSIDLIEIYGAVKVPGKYEFVPGDRVYDLIMIAGGTRLNIDTNYAELFRFVDDRDSVLVKPLNLKNIITDPRSPDNIQLQADDRIFIRTIPDFHYKAQVYIEGEVLYPGVYPIIEDTTTLSDIIAQAGGFTELASLDEARMYRSGYEALKDTELDRQIKISVDKLSEIEREYLLLRSDPDQGRVSIDFRDLFSGNGEKYDVTLKDGDRIIIPRMSNTVRIMGRVLKPGLLTYIPGADVDYYVKKAGGFTPSANKGKIRIIKGASGAILKPSSKVPIDIGDEILVPEKKETDWWELTKDVGLFLANLATVYFVVDRILE